MGLKGCGIFRDFPKPLAKYGWHDGPIFKLHQNGICSEMFNILIDFLSDTKQRVVLNGQCSSCANIRASVPLECILGPLLFLTYINNLSNDIKSKCKLFPDDTSLVSVFECSVINISTNDLNHDLEKISEWAFQQKMKFNPDPTKQTQKLIFSRKKLFLFTQLSILKTLQ